MEQVSELITVLSRQFTSHPIARNALSILLDSRLDISGYIAARYYFKATGQPRFARLALDGDERNPRPCVGADNRRMRVIG